MKPVILITLKPEPDPHNFGIGSYYAVRSNYCRAIIRAMPEIDLLDLRRITGRDVLQLQRAGRNFCLGGLSEG